MPFPVCILWQKATSRNQLKKKGKKFAEESKEHRTL